MEVCEAVGNGGVEVEEGVCAGEPAGGCGLWSARILAMISQKAEVVGDGEGELDKG